MIPTLHERDGTETAARRLAMLGLGWQELLIVLVIIMLIFGAGKLPDVARSLGTGVKAFKQEASVPVAAGGANPGASAAQSPPLDTTDV
jgi:sec-independent protein translocase protein TatA